MARDMNTTYECNVKPGVPKRRQLTARPLHVAFAIEALHGVSGGAERVLVDVSRIIHERGYRVTVITHEGRNGPSFYPLRFGIERVDARPRHSRRRKAPVLDRARGIAARSKIASIPIWLVQFVPMVLRLRRILRDTRPDVVIGFMPSMFPYMSLAVLGLPVKSVASVHNVPKREFGADPKRWNQNRMDRKMRRLSLRFSDAVTVLLPSFVRQLPLPEAAAKTRVIPNMVKRYEGPLADVRESPDEPNVILAVGRLADAKDHQSLIEAWAMLEDRFPNWEVRIFGNGPLKSSLSRRIRLAGVKRLKIHKPTPEIMSEYAAARILAMPSRHEGFGLVTAEALSVGLPVVGFATCEGTNELVQHGYNGLLANPRGGRARGFAVELEKMMTDADLRTRLAAAAPKSVERFDPEVIADHWEDLIRSLALVAHD